jgi:hypothetical protein
MQVQSLSALRRRVSDSDVVETADDSFPPEPLDLLTETDLFGGLTLVPPPMRQSGSGANIHSDVRTHGSHDLSCAVREAYQRAHAVVIARHGRWLCSHRGS